MNASPPNEVDPDDPLDSFVPETDVIGRIATPARVAVACIPILLMTVTPLLPFAITPTLWFNVPAVMVWIAALLVLTVLILQVIDRGINRQAAQARKGDSS